MVVVLDMSMTANFDVVVVLDMGMTVDVFLRSSRDSSSRRQSSCRKDCVVSQASVSMAAWVRWKNGFPRRIAFRSQMATRVCRAGVML